MIPSIIYYIIQWFLDVFCQNILRGRLERYDGNFRIIQQSLPILAQNLSQPKQRVQRVPRESSHGFLDGVIRICRINSPTKLSRVWAGVSILPSLYYITQQF